MKKIIKLKILFISTLLIILSGCSIDWNDEKYDEISKLKLEVQDLKNTIHEMQQSNEIELQKLASEKRNLKLQEDILQQKKEDAKLQKATIALEELKLNEDKCKVLSERILKGSKNAIGVTYDWLKGECVVTFTHPETGNVITTPLSQMKREVE